MTIERFRCIGLAMLAALSFVSADVIHMVAESGHVGELERLLSQGTNVDKRDEKGMTPLMHAVVGGNIEAAEFLLEKGADVGLKDSLGRDALDCALLAGQHEAAELLVEHGAGLDRMYDNGQTRLTMAALRGDIATVYFLLLYGADPAKKSREGLDALESARKAGDETTVEFIKTFTPPSAVEPRKGLSREDSLKLYSVKEYETSADLFDAIQAGRRSFVGHSFKEMDLAGMNLSFLDLREVTFDGADMRGALLLGSKLNGATFRTAYLRKANLQRSDVTGASFGDAYLTLADLRGVTGLEIEQLKRARNLYGAKLDPEMAELVKEYCKKPQLEDPGTEWVNNPWFTEATEKPGLDKRAEDGDADR
jgi:uncharacterized protein